MGENGEKNQDQGFLVDSEIEASKRKNQQGKRSNFVEDEESMVLSNSFAMDPIKIELNRLTNQIKEKDRELEEALNEIKSLRLTDRAKDKALLEVTEELNKLRGKLEASEGTIENKNLEIRRISEEKKDIVAAQLAAEATLRRVHAAQKDDDIPPLEEIILPLEAEIKFLRQEVVKLQEDNRALERLTKSKEDALIEAEREVQVAKTKAAVVDELQNKHQQLIKQNDICQEEYRILDKLHRKKVAEVEKLSKAVRDLEESLLSGAATVNAVRDYQRQLSQIKDENRKLERTLSRVKATENRAAVVIANEWKEQNDKVISVKQWIEERRVLEGEIQQLRDKLSVAERAAKAEGQLKEKLQLRLKVVEDGLKPSLQSGLPQQETRTIPNRLSRSRSVNGSDSLLSPRKNKNLNQKPSLPSPRSSVILSKATCASKSFDGAISLVENSPISKSNSDCDSTNGSIGEENESKEETSVTDKFTNDEVVSVVFYDFLQKEVISLRKTFLEKEQCLRDKDNSIEMLSRKIDTLTKAMEVETRKLRREKTVLEKEVIALKMERELDPKSRRSRAIS
ncbi:microtubule-associated protein 70-1-like [Carex rostrata]